MNSPRPANHPLDQKSILTYLVMPITILIYLEIFRAHIDALWQNKKMYLLYLLSFFYGFRHGQEDTVEQNCCHDDVVKVLVGGEKNASAACGAPWTEPEERFCCGEPVDVVLAETFRHHAECLQIKKIRNSFAENNSSVIFGFKL